MNRLMQWALSWTPLRGMISMIAARRVDPWTLEEAMRGNLSPGMPKSKVLEFVRSMRPFQCHDHGKEVTACWVEETGDLVRSWDIVVAFYFNEEERLLHYRQTETDFIDYDFIALK